MSYSKIHEGWRQTIGRLPPDISVVEFEMPSDRPEAGGTYAWPRLVVVVDGERLTVPCSVVTTAVVDRMAAAGWPPDVEISTDVWADAIAETMRSAAAYLKAHA